MRITTATTMDRAIAVLQRNQQSLTDAQERLSSGKKIARPSDDPAGAARVERDLAREARATASQRALEASRNAMVQAEGALGESSELVQQARELVVQAGNPTLSDGQRKSLADAIRGIRNQLLTVANRDDGAGGMLFGGQGSSQPPFVDAPGGVQFRGTQGVAMAASGEPLPLSSDGAEVFLHASSGNGVVVIEPGAGNATGAWVDAGRVIDPSAVTGDDYSVVFDVQPSGTTYDVLRNGAPTSIVAQPWRNGQAIEFEGLSMTVRGTPAVGDRYEVGPSQRDLSIFEALDRVSGDLAILNRTDAQRAQTVGTGLRDIDAALSSLIGERARLGGVLNRTDKAEQRIADSKLLAQTDRSAAEDADMVQAVSQFNQKQTSYDAALKAYSMVQRLSLFEYIR